jgi:DNA-binding response OmpR family regulator
LNKRTQEAQLREIQIDKIVLVEDNEEVRFLIKKILNKKQYSVIDVGNSSDALKVFTSIKDGRILLITDIILPDMNGRVLMAELKKQGYKFETLFISGYAENVIFHEHILDSGFHFLNKPFTPIELWNKIVQIYSPEKC